MVVVYGFYSYDTFLILLGDSSVVLHMYFRAA